MKWEERVYPTPLGWASLKIVCKKSHGHGFVLNQRRHLRLAAGGAAGKRVPEDSIGGGISCLEIFYAKILFKIFPSHTHIHTHTHGHGLVCWCLYCFELLGVVLAEGNSQWERKIAVEQKCPSKGSFKRIRTHP